VSNHDRYAALAAEGRLTLAEGFELTKAFPDKSNWSDLNRYQALLEAGKLTANEVRLLTGNQPLQSAA